MVIELKEPGKEPLRKVDQKSNDRLCPVCAILLDQEKHSDVVVDSCPDCEGVWLDAGELKKIISQSRSLKRKKPTARRNYENDDRPGRKRSKSPDQLVDWLEDLFD